MQLVNFLYLTPTETNLDLCKLSACRSMPTSAALDVVAKSLNLKFFEVLLYIPYNYNNGCRHHIIITMDVDYLLESKLPNSYYFFRCQLAGNSLAT